MIAERIKAYISEKQIDLASVAKKCNVHEKTLSAILNGETNLKAETYFYICNALNVPITQFMG